jgi:LPPG:FO 2-phospho-L-lactate transferase
MLGAGYPLSAVTEALCDRWKPGVRLLPATDDRIETHVVIDTGTGPRAIHFQEWWVRHRATPDAQRFVFVGAEDAKPAPGVLDAINGADVVLIAPSNPVVSVAPILAVAGIRDAIAHASAPVVGVSPIIGGAPVRGMADKCLAAVGAECSAAGVARLLGARTNGGILDGWLVDEKDEGPQEITTRKCPLWMTDEHATAAIVRAALELAGV